MLLSGKNVMVTGARRGIGRAIVQTFAQNGANIWACARKEDEAFAADMATLSEKCGTWIEPVYFDLMDAAGMRDAMRMIAKEKKPLDVLVNNAGEVVYDTFLMCSEAHLRRMTENNYIQPMLLTQSAARLIAKSGGGAILFLSSVSALRSEAGSMAYGGSKAAIAQATGVLARELAPLGIRVNALAPGMVDTDMQRTANVGYWQEMVDRTFLKRMARPEEIANVALFLCSDLSSYMTGQIVRVDGGM